MPARLFFLPFRPALDANAIVVPGAQLFFYLTGTTTPTPVYAESGLITPLSNPVVANAAGAWPAIYLDDGIVYRLVLKDDVGATLDDADPYIPGSFGEQGPAGVAGTAAANSGVTTSYGTEVANTSAFSSWHTLNAPTAAFTNSAGGDDRVNARLTSTVGKFTNGPTGHANYFDTVIALGVNLANAYTPLNTAMASGSFRIESKFAQGGASDPFAMEFHITSHSADATPVEFRAVSAFIPHLKANWPAYSSAFMRGGQINLYDGSSTVAGGNQRILFDLRPSVNVVEFAKTTTERAPGLSWNSNNLYICRQINAAGNAFVSMPYLNADDTIQIEAALFQQANAKANTAFGITAFNIGQCLLLPVGAYLDFVVSQAATAGAVFGLVRDVNATGTMTNRIENTGGGAAVHNVKGSAASAYQINDVQVVGARSTGWTAMTGTGSKGALAAAAAGTASAGYVQAELQGALNRIAALEARLKSYDDAFFAAGGIGA